SVDIAAGGRSPAISIYADSVLGGRRVSLSRRALDRLPVKRSRTPQCVCPDLSRLEWQVADLHQWRLLSAVAGRWQRAVLPFGRETDGGRSEAGPELRGERTKGAVRSCALAG